jgi:transcriptional regulator with XRE-family HTH domain
MPRSPFAEPYERLRTLLIEKRLHVGLTQRQLAVQLHRPQSFVSKYERGERRLDVVEFIEIANALGIDAGSTIHQLTQMKPS